MLMVDDEAAKLDKDRWCEIPVNAVFPRYVAKGADPDIVFDGSNNLIVLSLAQLRSFWSFVQQSPLTMPSCPSTLKVSSLLVKSHVFTTPSPEPEARTFSLSGSFAKT